MISFNTYPSYNKTCCVCGSKECINTKRDIDGSEGVMSFIKEVILLLSNQKRKDNGICSKCFQPILEKHSRFKGLARYMMLLQIRDSSLLDIQGAMNPYLGKVAQSDYIDYKTLLSCLNVVKRKVFNDLKQVKIAEESILTLSREELKLELDILINEDLVTKIVISTDGITKNELAKELGVRSTILDFIIKKNNIKGRSYRGKITYSEEEVSQIKKLL